MLCSVAAKVGGEVAPEGGSHELSSERTSTVRAFVEESGLVVPKQSERHPISICVTELVTWGVPIVGGGVSRALACSPALPKDCTVVVSCAATCTWLTFWQYDVHAETWICTIVCVVVLDSTGAGGTEDGGGCGGGGAGVLVGGGAGTVVVGGGGAAGTGVAGEGVPGVVGVPGGGEDVLRVGRGGAGVVGAVGGGPVVGVVGGGVVRGAGDGGAGLAGGGAAGGSAVIAAGTDAPPVGAGVVITGPGG